MIMFLYWCLCRQCLLPVVVSHSFFVENKQRASGIFSCVAGSRILGCCKGFFLARSFLSYSVRFVSNVCILKSDRKCIGKIFISILEIFQNKYLLCLLIQFSSCKEIRTCSNNSDSLSTLGTNMFKFLKIKICIYLDLYIYLLSVKKFS